ncbi:conserved hypothetical protein [Ricinus communis]|uniref:Secreted protein n=1 Tax=Ricinus communis TaxID=3988 RepID=B9RE43_RICCO|nr:conserved hypothetical protein [Ricinus communis]
MTQPHLPRSLMCVFATARCICLTRGCHDLMVVVVVAAASGPRPVAIQCAWFRSSTLRFDGYPNFSGYSS